MSTPEVNPKKKRFVSENWRKIQTFAKKRQIALSRDSRKDHVLWLRLSKLCDKELFVLTEHLPAKTGPLIFHWSCPKRWLYGDNPRRDLSVWQMHKFRAFGRFCFRPLYLLVATLSLFLVWDFCVSILTFTDGLVIGWFFLNVVPSSSLPHTPKQIKPKAW